jgi:uncharacterized damage-inducible protein DinB
MSKKENLETLLQSTRGVVGKLLDGITEEESMLRGKDNVNHIRWQAGHIVYCAYIRLKCLHADIPFPDGYQKMFGGGSIPSDNPGDYPTMEKLREELYDLHDKTLKQLATLNDADLDRTVSLGENRNPKSIDTALFFCAHEFYHAGQIATLNRVLGRERAFG